MNLTRGATRIDTKKYPLLILNLIIPGVFPSLLLISNALSVADAFSLTDFPKKPSLRLSLYQKFLFCQQYFLPLTYTAFILISSSNATRSASYLSFIIPLLTLSIFAGTAVAIYTLSISESPAFLTQV